MRVADTRRRARVPTAGLRRQCTETAETWCSDRSNKSSSLKSRSKNGMTRPRVYRHRTRPGYYNIVQRINYYYYYYCADHDVATTGERVWACVWVHGFGGDESISGDSWRVLTRDTLAWKTLLLTKIGGGGCRRGTWHFENLYWWSRDKDLAGSWFRSLMTVQRNTGFDGENERNGRWWISIYIFFSRTLHMILCLRKLNVPRDDSDVSNNRRRRL